MTFGIGAAVPGHVIVKKNIAIIAAGILLYALISYITGTACWFQATIGVPCPGCGSSRALQAIVRRDFAEAFFWHPLIVLSLIILPVLAVRHSVFRKKPHTALETKLIIGITVLYAAVFVVRMVIMFPHTAPMVMHEDTVWRLVFRLIFGTTQ